jgi:hypothetical protein
MQPPQRWGKMSRHSIPHHQLQMRGLLHAPAAFPGSTHWTGGWVYHTDDLVVTRREKSVPWPRSDTDAPIRGTNFSEFLSFGIGLKRVFSFTFGSIYPWALSGPQNRSGCGLEQKKQCPRRQRNPGSPSCYLLFYRLSYTGSWFRTTLLLQ